VLVRCIFLLYAQCSSVCFLKIISWYCFHFSLSFGLTQPLSAHVDLPAYFLFLSPLPHRKSSTGWLLPRCSLPRGGSVSQCSVSISLFSTNLFVHLFFSYLYTHTHTPHHHNRRHPHSPSSFHQVTQPEKKFYEWVTNCHVKYDRQIECVEHMGTVCEPDPLARDRAGSRKLVCVACAMECCLTMSVFLSSCRQWLFYVFPFLYCNMYICLKLSFFFNM